MAANAVQLQDFRLSSREKLLLGAVLAVTLITFASTFTFGWVYDDPPQIPGNPDLRWGRMGFLFTHHLWASATASGVTNARFYRPLLALWFLINKTLFGLHPHWFHVTSVFVHLLAVALAFFIARGLLKDTGGALLAAAIFGLHPLQAESVSWISAVNDPLAAVFCFASFLAYKKARVAQQDATRWWVWSAVFFLCALLTKEVSAVLPAIVLVDLWLDPSDGSTREARAGLARRIVVLYGAIGSAWMVVRGLVLGRVASATSSLGWGAVLLTAPKVFLFQLWHVVFPAGLSPHYDFRPLTSAATEESLLILLYAVAVPAAAAVFVVKKSRDLGVALAWLIFPVLPTLNLRWLNEDDFVHDRYMYMSMLGVALLAGAGFTALKRRWPAQRLILGFALVLVVGVAFAAAVQSQYWANDLVLFARGAQIAPQNEWAQLNYGSALAMRGQFEEAAGHFVLSYKLKPGWRAAGDAGFCYRMSHSLAPAQHWYNEALRLNPADADAWYGMGLVRIEEHKPEYALIFFQKALALQPEGVGFHAAVGYALDQLGRRDEALAEYQEELRLHPNQPDAQKAIDRLGATP